MVPGEKEIYTAVNFFVVNNLISKLACLVAYIPGVINFF